MPLVLRHICPEHIPSKRMGMQIIFFCDAGNKAGKKSENHFFCLESKAYRVKKVLVCGTGFFKLPDIIPRQLKVK
jgi:hypothetical protein